MCAHHVEKKKKSLSSICLARERFRENGAKYSRIFNINIIGKLKCLTYFYFFIIMVTRVCAPHVEKIRKVYRRFIWLEVAFQKMVQKQQNF